MKTFNPRNNSARNGHATGRPAETFEAGGTCASAGRHVLITGRAFDPSPPYTHTVPLDQPADALNAMKQRPEKILKALIIL